MVGNAAMFDQNAARTFALSDGFDGDTDFAEFFPVKYRVKSTLDASSGPASK